MSNYDETSRSSILEFSEKLRNKTLLESVPNKYKKDLISQMEIDSKKDNKGSFGTLLEKYYFESFQTKPEADFSQANLELKTAGLKLDKNGRYKKFQSRLSLSSINFHKIISENFTSSSFYKKNKNILIIFYIHDESLHVAERKIGFIGIYSLNGDDKQIIKADWEFIKKAVLAGEAHKLGAQHNWNTQNLEASTTGGKAVTNFVTQPNSETKARRRRFAYKSRFWEKVIQEIINKDASIQTIDNWSEIYKIFKPFIGYKIDEICKDLNYQLGKGKNKFSNLTKEIIRKKGNENLSRDLMVSIKSNNAKKDGIIFRTIRINNKNKIQEEISLPAFSEENIRDNSWEESEFFNYLNKPFIFVIFRESNKNKLVFHDIKYYQMKDVDMQSAKKVWIDTKNKINKNRNDFIKISDKQNFHVRPHDLKGKGKNSFWINKDFVQKII